MLEKQEEKEPITFVWFCCINTNTRSSRVCRKIISSVGKKTRTVRSENVDTGRCVAFNWFTSINTFQFLPLYPTIFTTSSKRLRDNSFYIFRKYRIT